MLSAETNIVNRLGLHARAAALLVKLANSYKTEITIANGPHKANAKSIMEVLMLAATKGTTVKITADGPDENEALEAILQLVNNKFNESE